MLSPKELAARAEKDPEFFVREVLGCDPWPRQVEIMESVRDNEETDVPSCHSAGKSWIAARIVLWFGSCFPGSRVITTAPTERQVKGILWSEIRTAYGASKYPLGGTMLTLDWKISEDWWSTGFTAPQWDPNRFQGFHAPHILVVVDEACGIAPAIDEQILSLVSGGHARILRIGNPVDPQSAFADSCEAHTGTVLPISAFDTPNFTTFGLTPKDFEDDAWERKIDGAPMPRPELISPKWVAARRKGWGVDSSSYIARILGEFPTVAEGSYYAKLMQTAEIEGRVCEVPYEPLLPVHTCWDLGMDDATAIWFFQVARSGQIRWIDYMEDSGFGFPTYAKRLREKPYVYGKHLGPHDLAVRELGVEVSRQATAKKLGLEFEIAPKLDPADGIEAVRSLLHRSWFDRVKCKEGVKALKAYRQDRNERTGEFTGKPLHNWASHAADGIRTGATAMPESVERRWKPLERHQGVRMSSMRQQVQIKKLEERNEELEKRLVTVEGRQDDLEKLVQRAMSKTKEKPDGRTPATA